MTPPRADDEDGFTVVELVIAMLIMLIITVPLVASFVLGIKATREGQQDVISSTDAQLVSAYFDIDVGGSEEVRMTTGPCAIAGGTPVLSLVSHDAGVERIVTYSTVPDPEMQAELELTGTTVYSLIRATCGAPGATGEGPVTLGRQLVAAGAVAAAAVSCDQTTTCSATPRTVTLTLQEASRVLKDSAAAGAAEVFTFGVTAVRKVSP